MPLVNISRYRLNRIQSEPAPKLFHTPDNLYYQMAKGEISLQDWEPPWIISKKDLHVKGALPI